VAQISISGSCLDTVAATLRQRVTTKTVPPPAIVYDCLVLGSAT